MSLKKVQKQGRDERTQEDYPYICKKYTADVQKQGRDEKTQEDYPTFAAYFLQM